MHETPQQYMTRVLGYVEGKDPLRIQQATVKRLATLLKPLSKQRLTMHPAPGKWSIAEILAHLADVELVASWRMRLILGQNGATLQAFDQDVWANTFNYARQDPKASLQMFQVIRKANLALLKALPKHMWENYGMHQERGKEPLAQIVRMFAGHDLNHLRQIEHLARKGSGRKKR